jgi:integrase
MFTGARIGELAQLHVGDLEQHGAGAWFVTIRHDAATGQTTKSGHSRPAIVHSRLISLGFLDFVGRQKSRADTDGKPQLFPELEANDRDQIGAKPSEFWRDYLAAIKIKSGRDGFGAHSFRHTMADRLRDEAGLLDDQIEVALGHNQKTVTGGYGRIRQGTVPQLSGMMEQVVFKGVRLDHLILSES